MFQVICIDSGKTLKCINSDRISMGVVEGEIYTVVQIREANGRQYYILEEREPDLGYEDHLFAPISDVDETTFERNYQKETI